jgi:carbamoyl-phosphate synthase large subunit
VFLSVRESDKVHAEQIARDLLSLGFKIIATRGTAQFLQDKGLKVEVVNKVREGRPHIVDLLKDNQVALVLNTTEGAASIADSFSIRRTALMNKIPYSTTITGSRAYVQAIAALKKGGGLDVKPLQAYFSPVVIPAKTGS